MPAGIDYLVVTEYTSYADAGIIKTHTEQKLRVTNVKKIAAPMGYMMAKADSMSDGDILSLSSHNMKINNVYVFRANITSFNAIQFSKEASLIVNGTNIVVTNDSGGATIPHGLTITGDITIMICNETDTYSSLIRVISDGTEFSYTTPVRFLMDQGIPKITSQGSSLTNCVFSWTSKNIDAPIWMFGDSYFSWYQQRWTYYLARDGYTKSVMLNGFAGQASATAYQSLANLLEVTQPKIVVWCLGMNDPDANGAVNASWKQYYDKVKQLAEAYEFELILYTVPSTPTMDNSYKDAIIRASDYRYIDADNAVRIDNEGHWIAGALDTDNVHPTAIGAKILYYAILTELPELMNDY